MYAERVATRTLRLEVVEAAKAWRAARYPERQNARALRSTAAALAYAVESLELVEQP